MFWFQALYIAKALFSSGWTASLLVLSTSMEPTDGHVAVIMNFVGFELRL